MLKNNYKKVQQVLLIILAANLLVAVLKIVLGSIIKSASMTADGFHSLSDGSSNIVGIIGIKLASNPEDSDHPYGHYKFETMTGLIISGLLFVVGGNVIFGAIDRFKNPVVPDITITSLIVLLVTLAINIFVSISEYRQGRQLNSSILISDSMHTRSDIYVSVGVLATLIGVKLGLPPIIDPIASLIVAGFILHAGYEIFKDNSSILLDKAAIDSAKIRDLAMQCDEVCDVHDIRSRGTANCIYIDLHLMVDPGLSVEHSHELTHDLENMIRKTFHDNIHLIAHIEPYEEEPAS